jgi:hypothetical protein
VLLPQQLNNLINKSIKGNVRARKGCKLQEDNPLLPVINAGCRTRKHTAAAPAATAAAAAAVAAQICSCAD